MPAIVRESSPDIDRFAILRFAPAPIVWVPPASASVPTPATDPEKVDVPVRVSVSSAAIDKVVLAATVSVCAKVRLVFTLRVSPPESDTVWTPSVVPAFSVCVPPAKASVPGPSMAPLKRSFRAVTAIVPLPTRIVPPPTSLTDMVLVPAPPILASVPAFVKSDPVAAPTPIPLLFSRRKTPPAALASVAADVEPSPTAMGL